MQRMCIETDKSTEEDIDQFMRTAAEKDVLSIVGAHSQFDTFTEDRLRYTLDTALVHDLAVISVEEAMKVLRV